MISLELMVIFVPLMVGIGLMPLFKRVKGDAADYLTKPLWLVFARGAGAGLPAGILGAALIPLDQKGSKQFTMFRAGQARGDTVVWRWNAHNSITFHRKEIHHGKTGTSQGTTTSKEQ